ncbi:MAG: metallophosphoesterase [Ignavibacteriae bacterium]|nr:metallophosphoesterase [Ignavibacteriota bacterium]
MHQQQFSVFWIINITLFIILDTYVIYNWQKYVRRRKHSPWLYKPLWIVAAIMISVFAFVRLSSFEANNPITSHNIMIVLYIWYLPKLIISIVLLFKDITRLIIFCIKLIIEFYDKRISKKHSRVSHSGSGNDTPDSVIVPRRDFLQKAAWMTAGAPFIIAGNGMFRTAFDFQTYEHFLPISGLPPEFEGLRIVQISDIHSGSFSSSKPMREVRLIIESLRPDIILITGDYVNFNANELSITFPELKKLSAPLGVYGSIGNHDHYMSQEDHETLKNGIRDAGINLLVNSNSVIRVDGSELNLAAIDNSGLGQNFGRINEAMSGLNTANPTILMAHDPTFWDKQVRGKMPAIDVMLSGHTHGGQVGIHILGEDYSFARMVYKQWAGMYTDKDQILYVNRGMGMVGPPLRLAIEPEITVFTLTRPENKG